LFPPFLFVGAVLQPQIALSSAVAGAAHMASTVAAYEVGTETLNFKPVAFSKAADITSPPVVMTCASTDGTKNTSIGLASVPRSPPWAATAWMETDKADTSNMMSNNTESLLSLIVSLAYTID